MKDDIQQLRVEEFPPMLQEIPDAPKKLFLRGSLPSWNKYKLLTVVGSRKYSAYGKQVCERLIQGLAGFPVIIVSGLALGIDSIAHRSALKAGIPTISVPGSGLSDAVLYPRSHTRLAKDIISAGGALLSEFEPDAKPVKWTFARRNRIMAGMSHATLLIEAEEKSGTLITARLATEYDRELLVVPHDITRPSSKGVHQFLKLGATPITESADILRVLGIEEQKAGAPSARPHTQLTKEEQLIVNMLKDAPLSRNDLLEKIKIDTTKANITISTLEIKGIIKEQLGVLTLT